MVSSRPAYRRPKSYGRWLCSGRKSRRLGVGLTILRTRQYPACAAGGGSLSRLFHGARRVGRTATARRRAETRAAWNPTDPAALKRWLRRWTNVRHREAAERTCSRRLRPALPAELADALFAADTERAFADTGHSLDFINKAFECLDLVGWQHAAALLRLSSVRW